MTQNRLLLLAGGAAKALVGKVQDRFRADTGVRIDGMFTAVGTVRDKFVAGAPADVLVLSQAVMDELSEMGLVAADSARSVGAVRTGVAICDDAPAPDIANADAFRALLLRARAVYIPDPDRSTAGIHVMKVLDRLGVREEVAPKLNAFPNGETAMARLAEDAEPGAVGCTQMTEIKMTPGLTLAGPLPGDLDLATTYVAALSAMAQDPATGRRLIDLLTGPETIEIRRDCGFETG